MYHSSSGRCDYNTVSKIPPLVEITLDIENTKSMKISLEKGSTKDHIEHVIKMESQSDYFASLEKEKLKEIISSFVKIHGTSR